MKLRWLIALIFKYIKNNKNEIIVGEIRKLDPLVSS